ncbi:HAMP domain-containing sensor histidine kinase [Actinacidiphila acidipaludis]|uniref:histidine kinase n=1 Tax=Actinacidiphila acidipaludis TaxID=2873382 RepID=A0ABS7QFF9_9ACTN|nr:HAMP domain-containing sensor histidine kinase [Streptomyces acidipaludis]MBY8880682.1 HAMP domain-containing histidine kinase [Streptomyces acidipaludis]
MNLAGIHGRLRPARAGVRLRILAGLAVLLVAGLTASSLTSALLLESFLHKRYTRTLRDSAARMRAVLVRGPQVANGDQLSALLGPPLGSIAVDGHDRILLSTGTGDLAPEAMVTATATVPAGHVVDYDDVEGLDDLSAIRIPSLGLTLERSGAPAVKPAAVILVIDTSVDDSTTDTLITRQLAIVACALVLLLALAVLVLRLGMRPLAKMAASADAIAEGHLTERLPTRGNRSETDQLAEAVNRAFDAQARAEATVRSLAADTSHELRTPLSTISGWLDLHRQGGLTGPRLETALAHIENQVGRMRLLVEDLSLLARLDAGRPIERAPLDLTALAASVVQDAQVIYPDRGITLTAAGPAQVTGDAARLQQVLRNLVGNACQHTPTQTAVHVTVTTDPGHVHVVVADDGPGIAPQDLPRVFERFWRAEASRSRTYGGSGLGLAIVEAIIHAHHGHVSVESAVGVGTTVTVRLDAHRADAPPRDKESVIAEPGYTE